jgi:pimeloyl-ACP methyl ester carboxylesterase
MKRDFRYKCYGQGTPVALVPGLDGLTEFFSDVIPELARNHKVIVYHLPLRREADECARQYSFEFIAEDLKSVLEELGIAKAHIIGESFGGVVTQILALNHPDAVDRLVLISTAPKFDLSVKNRLLLPFFRFIPMWLFARLHLRDVCEPHDPQWAKDLFVRGVSWADHASVLARAQIVSRVDLRARITEVKAPVLLVVGSSDRFTGQASRQMQQLLPGARLVEIPDGGHLCHVTHPEQFLDAVLPFLGNGAAPGR